MIWSLYFLFVPRYCGTFTMNVIMGTVFGIQVNSQKDCQNQFVTNAEIFLEGGGVHKTIFQQLLSNLSVILFIYSLVYFY